MFGIPLEAIVTIASAAGSWWMKHKSQQSAYLAEERKAHREDHMQVGKLSDAAAKRSSPWLRKFAAIVIILATFGGIIAAAFLEIPVAEIDEIPQKSFLWGLFKWGDTIRVTTAEGLVFPGWVRYSICTVVGFLFGPGFAKTK